MSSTQWREKKHDEVFQSTLRGLENRKEVDSGFSLEDAQATLDHLYVQDGNDQGGRGDLQDIIIQAMILAHETFILEWKHHLDCKE